MLVAHKIVKAACVDSEHDVVIVIVYQIDCHC